MDRDAQLLTLRDVTQVDPAVAQIKNTTTYRGRSAPLLKRSLFEFVLATALETAWDGGAEVSRGRSSRRGKTPRVVTFAARDEGLNCLMQGSSGEA